MRLKLLILPVILVASALSGCDIINPADPIPTYVKIDSFSFQETDPAQTGSISNKIEAVWVYFNSQAVGVFELPCSVPIITDKKGVVSVAPGVVYSGFKDYHSQYPFYAFDTLTIEPKPGGVIDFKPNTHYISNFRLAYNEDFNIGNDFERADANRVTDTSLNVVYDVDKVFEGSGSGYIYMDAAHTTSEVVNSNPFSINSGRAFLEINYKCSASFIVGLRATLANGVAAYKYFQGLNPSSDWNKVYIDIEPTVGELKGIKYQILIKSEVPPGAQDGYILLDNLKVVTY